MAKTTTDAREDDSPPIPTSQAAWDVLVTGFEAGTLPWAAWRHPQHLAVTAWYMRRDGFERTRTELPVRIRAFNAAHGVETTLERGYHETLTRFWLDQVQAYLQTAPADTRELLAGLDAALGDKNLPYTVYSRERLMSGEARTTYLAPDVSARP